MNRQDIEIKYNITLTDNQWRIIEAEVSDKDDWEDDNEIIDDIVSNLKSYEDEYAWWENLTVNQE